MTMKKYRLYDKDRNITQIYDLNELISKTFRRGKFEYRGEWTGLKDKNGKEIYEGDVVIKHSWRGDERVVVEFNNGCFIAGYIVHDLGSEGNCMREEEFTVIGNIYENPELTPKAHN
jgi:uncharacterized phage protein (TIGR01671 family)